MSEKENGQRRTWKELFAEWLFQQGVSTVLLIANVGVTCYGLYYLLNTVIPRHDEAVERMVARIETQHATTIKYIMDTFKEAERNRRS